MNTADIIEAVANCDDYDQLKKIREALEARAETLKAEFMARAEAMGLACHDGNGRPPRKKRESKDANT